MIRILNKSKNSLIDTIIHTDYLLHYDIIIHMYF